MGIERTLYSLAGYSFMDLNSRLKVGACIFFEFILRFNGPIILK